jgi:hypothetical protein
LIAASGTPQQIAAITDFVAKGGGWIAIHSGGGCFKNSEEYANLVGSRFLSHGTGTFTADIVIRDHADVDAAALGEPGRYPGACTAEMANCGAAHPSSTTQRVMRCPRSQL